MNQTKYEDTDVSIINDQNSNIYETTSSKSKVPNFSQKDNTVNIENIYASQIVEEIRREREKSTTKRKFKEALQNKRQQSSDSDNEIQKVIDEMYANQAKQYTGESSLDHEENNDEERTTHTEDSTDKMEDTNENTTDNHVIDEGTQTDSNTSNYDDDDEQYQYEEIDLKSVPNIQTVNDKDVEIREVNDTTSTDEHNDDQLSEDNLNVAPIHSTKDKHHHFNKNDDAHLSKVNKLQEDNYTSKEK